MDVALFVSITRMERRRRRFHAPRMVRGGARGRIRMLDVELAQRRGLLRRPTLAVETPNGNPRMLRRMVGFAPTNRNGSRCCAKFRPGIFLVRRRSRPEKRTNVVCLPNGGLSRGAPDLPRADSEYVIFYAPKNPKENKMKTIIELPPETERAWRRKGWSTDKIERECRRLAKMSARSWVLERSLRKLRRRKGRRIFFGSTCCVCFEDFEGTARLASRRCGHVVCEPCADVLDACPLCRRL